MEKNCYLFCFVFACIPNFSLADQSCDGLGLAVQNDSVSQTVHGNFSRQTEGINIDLYSSKPDDEISDDLYFEDCRNHDQYKYFSTPMHSVVGGEEFIVRAGNKRLDVPRLAPFSTIQFLGICREETSERDYLIIQTDDPGSGPNTHRYYFSYSGADYLLTEHVETNILPTDPLLVSCPAATTLLDRNTRCSCRINEAQSFKTRIKSWFNQHKPRQQKTRDANKLEPFVLSPENVELMSSLFPEHPTSGDHMELFDAPEKWGMHYGMVTLVENNQHAIFMPFYTQTCDSAGLLVHHDKLKGKWRIFFDLPSGCSRATLYYPYDLDIKGHYLFANLHLDNSSFRTERVRIHLKSYSIELIPQSRESEYDDY